MTLRPQLGTLNFQMTVHKIDICLHHKPLTMHEFSAADVRVRSQTRWHHELVGMFARHDFEQPMHALMGKGKSSAKKAAVKNHAAMR